MTPGGALSRWASRVLARHPWLVLLAAALLTAASTARVLRAIQREEMFKTARLELVGEGVEYVGRYQDLEREFPDLEAIVIAVESERPAATLALARELERRLQADREHFASVFARVDPASLGAGALLWAGPSAASRGADAVERAVPRLLEAGALAGTLEAIAGELRALARGPAQAEAPPGAELLGAGVEGLLSRLEDALAGRTPPAGSLDDPLQLEEQGWAWADEGRRLLVMLVAGRDLPGDLDPQGPSVQALRALVAELAPAHPEVRVGITGKPALQVDEMGTYQSDAVRASLVSLIGVTLLQVLGLRRLLAPLMIGGCMSLAVVWTLGAATLWPGHLNLLATVFVVIVIGLGDDYAIHLVIRYDWERARGRPPEEALREVLVSTGSAIGVAGVTTVLAFAACFLSEFRGLREFGAVAGFGVLAAALASVTVLPSLLVLVDRRDRARPPSPAPTADERARPGLLDRALHGLDRLSERRPLLPLGAVVALTAGAAALAPGLAWEPSLIALQDPSLDSVQLELRLLHHERFTSWSMAWPAPDLPALRAAAARVSALPEVRRVESVDDALPPEQEGALPHVARLQAALAPLAAATELPALDPARLQRALAALEEACEEAGGAALSSGRGEAVARLAAWAERCQAARQALSRGPGRTAELELALSASLRALALRLSAPPVRALSPADLPPALRERLVGKSGRYLLRILPRGDMWQEPELAAFVGAVQAALPQATGVPELVLRGSQLMVQGYLQAGLWAFLGVTVCIALYFRAPGPVLLSLLTLVLGAVWTTGLTALCGVGINPANLVALPLLVGIGINAPVYVIHHARQEPHEALLGSSLGRALIYSALTSVVGFGSLQLAHHRGMASIGSTTAIGVLSCLLAALLVPPPLLALLRRRRPPVATGAPPASSKNQPTG